MDKNTGRMRARPEANPCLEQVPVDRLAAKITHTHAHTHMHTHTIEQTLIPRPGTSKQHLLSASCVLETKFFSISHISLDFLGF